MFEVEAKVPLSAAHLKRVKNLIKKEAVFKEKTKVIDEYYSDSKEFGLRIRKRGKKITLDIKQKKRGKGMEENREIEIPIKNKGKIKKFLIEKLGIPLKVKKEKDGEVYKKGDFQIEINHIKSLGTFLEIEKVFKEKKEIPKTKKELKKLFKSLGFSPKEFEKKYYLELLKEKK